jgi:hypothetical protein
VDVGGAALNCRLEYLDHLEPTWRFLAGIMPGSRAGEALFRRVIGLIRVSECVSVALTPEPGTWANPLLTVVYYPFQSVRSSRTARRPCPEWVPGAIPCRPADAFGGTLVAAPVGEGEDATDRGGECISGACWKWRSMRRGRRWVCIART